MSGAATALGLVTQCNAQTSTIAIPPMADATLYEEPTGLIANGNGSHLFAGLTISHSTRRSLIRFDVANAIPQGSRITSVTMSMNVSRSIHYHPLPLTLHRVLYSWQEGGSQAPGPEGGGAPATPGDVTWLHRSHPNILWTTPGGDYAAEPLGSGVSGQNGPVLWPSTGPLVACVQDWLNHPANNHGWLIRSDEVLPRAVRRLDSREHRVPGVRPTLQVTYLPPGTWTSFGAGCGNPVPTMNLSGAVGQGGQIAFHIQSLPHNYATNFLSLGLSQTPWAVRTGCLLYLETDTLATTDLVQLDAAGQHILTLLIPVSAGLTGLPLGAQSAILDPNWPLGFGLTNATLSVLL